MLSAPPLLRATTTGGAGEALGRADFEQMANEVGGALLGTLSKRLNLVLAFGAAAGACHARMRDALSEAAQAELDPTVSARLQETVAALGLGDGAWDSAGPVRSRQREGPRSGYDGIVPRTGGSGCVGSA